MHTDEHTASVNYVTQYCIPESELACAAGIGASALLQLRSADVVPQPTYRIGNFGVISNIARLGTVGPGEGRAYYGPSVLPWLRLSALIARDEPITVRSRLVAWLTGDLVQALENQRDSATMNGWAHVFSNGHPDPNAVHEEVMRCWEDWMNGGWAVCLRCFDGYHLATKEIERRRISMLTNDWTAKELTGAERFALLGAVERLASVILPFAPHERAEGTPGKFIFRTVAQYGLPWNSTGYVQFG